jgi:ABC-type dipeptide/oligopeptide/nickel transport system permease component
MIGFLLRRVGWAVVTLLVLVTVVFYGVNLLIPYTYATQFWFVGGAELVQEVMEALRLDRPLWERHLAYLAGLFSGTPLGFEFGGQPVLRLIGRALPVTLLAFGLAGLVAFIFGDWFGRAVAWHRGRLVGGGASALSVALYTAFPPLLVFVLLYFGVEVVAGWRSAAGLGATADAEWARSPFTEEQVTAVVASGLILALVVAVVVRAVARRKGLRMVSVLALPASLAGFFAAAAIIGIGSETLEVLLVPLDLAAPGAAGSPLVAAVALALIAFGEVVMVSRAGMYGEMSEPYVLTAEAKGVPSRIVRDRHVGRNATLPTLTRMVSGVPYVLVGLFIIEWELGLPGLALLFFDAIETVNVPLVIGILVVVGVIGMLLRIIIEVLHVVLDPRIRLVKAEP